MDGREIADRFTLITATPEQAAAMHRVRFAAEGLAHTINVAAPDGREKSAAITKLEEAVFWANRAIAVRK